MLSFVKRYCKFIKKHWKLLLGGLTTLGLFVIGSRLKTRSAKKKVGVISDRELAIRDLASSRLERDILLSGEEFSTTLMKLHKENSDTTEDILHTMAIRENELKEQDENIDIALSNLGIEKFEGGE